MTNPSAEDVIAELVAEMRSEPKRAWAQFSPGHSREKVCRAIHVDEWARRLAALVEIVTRQREEVDQLRHALRNVRLSAASARTFGHSGAPALEAQVEKKNNKLDHILRFCAEAGEAGSILRADEEPSAQLNVAHSASAQQSPLCQICGHPMPPGEEMFNYHGYSGPCPAPSAAALPHQQESPQEIAIGVALLRLVPPSALIGIFNHLLRESDWGAVNVPRRIERGDCFSVEFDRFTRTQVLAARDFLIAIPAADSHQQAPEQAPAPESPSSIACPVLQSQVDYAVAAAIIAHKAHMLRRDPCGCIHDGTAIVQWCRDAPPSDRSQDPQD